MNVENPLTGETLNFDPNQPRDEEGKWTVGSRLSRKDVIEHISKVNPPEQVKSGRLTIEAWADKFLSDDEEFEVSLVHPLSMNLPMEAGDKLKVEAYTQLKSEAPPIVVDANDKIQARIGGGRLEQAYGIQPHTVVDGKHRLEAAIRRGDKSILAVVPSRLTTKINQLSHSIELREFVTDYAEGKGYEITELIMSDYGPRVSAKTPEGLTRQWGPTDLDRIGKKLGKEFLFGSER